MGGSQSLPQKQALGKTLPFKHDYFSIEDIDNKVKEGFELIKDIELLRCNFIPLWNELLKQSGAIVLKEPHFESAVHGLLMKISSDLDGNLYNNINISIEDPYISFIKDTTDLTSDANILIQSFENVCVFYQQNYKIIEDIEAKYEKYYRGIGYMRKDQEAFFTKMGATPKNALSYSKILRKYLMTFKRGIDVIQLIKKNVKEIQLCLEEYKEHCKNEVLMKKFEQIGRISKRKKYIKLTKIMYLFSPELKLSNYEDYYDRIVEYSTIEQNANQVLAFYKQTIKDLNKKKRNQMPIAKPKEEKSIDKAQLSHPLEIQNQNITISFTESNVKIEGSSINPTNNLNQEVISFHKHKPLSDISILDNIDNNDDDVEDNESITRKTENMQHLNSISIPKLKNKFSSKILEANISINNKSFCSTRTFVAYIKQHIPLKNINQLHLKRTLKITQEKNVYPTAFASANDINILIVGLTNGLIILVQFSSLKILKTISIHSDKVKKFIYLNDGKTLLSCGKDGNIFKHDLIKFDSVLIAHDHSIKTFSQVYTGYTIYTGGNHYITNYDYINHIQLDKWKGHEQKILDMMYDFHRSLLLTCSADKSIKLWNIQTKECVGVLKGTLLTEEIYSMTMSDSKEEFIISSLSKDKYITFWNLDNKNKTKSIKLKDNGIKVFYLHDGNHVCVINKHASMTIYDIHTLTAKHFHYEGYDDEIMRFTAGEYYDDGKNIVIGTKNGFIQFWHC